MIQADWRRSEMSSAWQSHLPGRIESILIIEKVRLLGLFMDGPTTAIIPIQ